MIYRKNSKLQNRRRLLKGLLLLLSVILIPVLPVLTGCQTVRVKPDIVYERTLVSMAPELPAFPTWPQVNWIYQNGMYCLTESDADLVLDYLENAIPQYRFGINQYEEQLQLVFDALLHEENKKE